MEGTWPLVGRVTELERVREQLRRRAGGVVFAGPAGVGKTRLAAESLQVATGCGFAALRVAATRASAGLPFGAFAPLLPEGSVGVDRMEMLQAISRAIRDRGEGKPVALVVDDAHLLDEASAALTHQLASAHDVAVLVTVRSTEPVSDAVVALWKDALAQRIDVAPLSAAEVDELLRSALGGPVDGAVAGLLSARSQGNPLYLRELLNGAVDSGVLRTDQGLWSLAGDLLPSGRLVELIEARLVGLDDADRAVLATVAIGEPLGVDLLPDAAIRASIESLERRGLVRLESDGRRLHVRPAHPLYGEVVRARLPVLRSRAVRRTLADAVERCGARRRDDVLRVASWRLDSGGEIRPELMLAAGRRARALFDFQLAERLTRTGIEAGAGFEAELFLGELLYLQGRHRETAEYLKDLASRVGTDRDRARVALMRIDGLIWYGRLEEAMHVLEDTDVDDPAYRDELTAQRAVLAFLGGHTTLAIELAEPLLGRVSGDALVLACFTTEYAHCMRGRIDAALAAMRHGIAGARELTGGHMSWHPVVLTAVSARVLSFGGRVGEAETVGLRGYSEALAEGSIEHRSWFSFALSDCYLAQGRAASATRWAREAVNLTGSLDRGVYLPHTMLNLAAAHTMAGRIDAAEAVMDEIDRMASPLIRWQAADFHRVRAWMAAGRDNLTAAGALLDEAAAIARRGGDDALESAALHDRARLGAAREVTDRLAELAQVVEGPFVAARAAHVAALIAGDAPALEEAASEFEDIPAFLLAAEAAADAAVAWRRAGEPRRAVAAEHRAHALADQCEGARTPALAGLTVRAALTVRELEIARLAAAGVANKLIAERLCLSLHTVQNKLHTAYQKLGVAGRADLAQALRQY